MLETALLPSTPGQFDVTKVVWCMCFIDVEEQIGLLNYKDPFVVRGFPMSVVSQEELAPSSTLSAPELFLPLGFCPRSTVSAPSPFFMLVARPASLVASCCSSFSNRSPFDQNC